MVEILLHRPIYFPNLFKDADQPFQVIKNAKKRIAIGCHLRASSDHLHAETQLLPVVNSLEMVCAQYLSSALRRTHPSHAIVTHLSGARNREANPSFKICTKNFGTPNEEYNSNRRRRADIQRNSHQNSPGSDSHPATKPHQSNPTAYCGPSGKEPFPKTTEHPYPNFVQGFAKTGIATKIDSTHQSIQPTQNAVIIKCYYSA